MSPLPLVEDQLLLNAVEDHGPCMIGLDRKDDTVSTQWTGLPPCTCGISGTWRPRISADAAAVRHQGADVSVTRVRWSLASPWSGHACLGARGHSTHMSDAVAL